MNCTDLTELIGRKDSSSSNGHQGGMPCWANTDRNDPILAYHGMFVGFNDKRRMW